MELGTTYAKATRQNVQTIVDAYRAATNTSLSFVSKRFYGNAGFLEGFLNSEQSMSIDKLDRLICDMCEAWPPGAKFPDCKPVLMPRPEKRRRENISVETAPAA